jgi:hypothetical protein
MMVKSALAKNLRIRILIETDIVDVNDNVTRSILAAREIAETSIERIGGGRLDPFTAYPIPMNHGSRQLVDYSKY